MFHSRRTALDSAALLLGGALLVLLLLLRLLGILAVQPGFVCGHGVPRGAGQGSGTPTITVVWNSPGAGSVTAYRILSSTGCVGTASLSVNVGQNSLEEDMVVSQLNAYPNPAQNIMMIEIPVIDDSKPVEIEVLSSIGARVMQQSETANGKSLMMTLDVSQYPSGMYLLSVRNNGVRQTMRFIKE